MQEIEQETNQEPLLVVPFEDKKRDFWDGLLATVKLIILEPGNFFRNYRMNGGGSLIRPVLFALVVGWVAALVNMFWDKIFGNPIIMMLQKYFPELEDYAAANQGTMPATLELIMGMFFATFAILFGVFMSAGIYHLLLMLVKGNRKGFETTLCIVCYANVSSLVAIIPMIGVFINGIYNMVLEIIGLKEGHRIEPHKAVFAVLGPLLFICLCGFLIGFFAISGGMLAGG